MKSIPKKKELRENVLEKNLYFGVCPTSGCRIIISHKAISTSPLGY